MYRKRKIFHPKVCSVTIKYNLYEMKVKVAYLKNLLKNYIQRWLFKKSLY